MLFSTESKPGSDDGDISNRAHVMNIEDVLLELNVNADTGLSSLESESRAEEFGPNRIPESKSSSVLERLWAQINSFIIYVLIAGAALSFGFNHFVDGNVIIGVVVINVLLGFFMESRAANATDALKHMMSAQALVLRDGEKHDILSDCVTMGDVYFLQPGDVVPADGRIIKAVGLSVLEAALTGESHAIEKDTLPVEHANAPIAERKCMVYSGTQVLKGTATVVVTAIGPDCEIGKISGMLANVEPEKTPLLVHLDRFGMILSAVVIILALITFGIAYARGLSVATSLGIAVGVAVAAIPEGLPSCITVTFSMGVRYMAKRHAIVKSLPAVETLGSVSIICTDKTGTLTVNRMTVKVVCTAAATLELNDDGSVQASADGSPATSVSLGSILPGLLCNDCVLKLVEEPKSPSNFSAAHGDIELGMSGTEEKVGDADQDGQSQAYTQPASPRHKNIQAPTAAPASAQDKQRGRPKRKISSRNLLEERSYTVSGDPTEACLVVLAVRLQHNSPGAVRALQAENTRLDEIPFDSSCKYMATLHYITAELFQSMVVVAAQGGAAVGSAVMVSDTLVKVVMVKGAPEKVLSLCFADTQELAQWTKRAEDLAKQGMRVLALAFRHVPDEYAFSGHLSSAATTKASDRFTMLSLVGIIDPPRAEAIEAVQDAQRAGITVKMITGDHPTTAMAIGRMLGLRTDRGSAITGADLDTITITSMATFDQTVLRNDVFARTTPEHKLRIVESLRRQQFICSMTGDGVNDAPALKAANIGVAMGITGTEVAKDAANMIITDDNFATIVDAIRIGRCVYANLLKIITFVLPSNGGQAFSIIGALIIDVEVPITALQILWVNMVISVALGIVLAFDKPEHRVLTDPPRPPGKQIFGRLLIWRVVSVTLMLVLVVLGIFQWEKQRHSNLNYLRTVAVNALTVGQVCYIFNCRNVRDNVTPCELVGGNKALFFGIALVAICQSVLTYAPPFQYVFGTAGLDGVSWGKIVLLSVAVFLAVECDKYAAKCIKRCRKRHTSSRRHHWHAPSVGEQLHRDTFITAPASAVV